MSEKTKIQLEYLLNCSPKILYTWLSTASGLGEWFADNVKVKGKRYVFVWDDTEQIAEKTLQKENKLVRFTWEGEEEFFEFRIIQDELTGDVSLIVVDFADEDQDAEEVKGLWDNQIAALKQVLGS